MPFLVFAHELPLPQGTTEADIALIPHGCTTEDEAYRIAFRLLDAGSTVLRIERHDGSVINRVAINEEYFAKTGRWPR